MNIKPTNISEEEKARIFEESLKNQTPYIEKEPVKIQPVKRGRWIPQGDDMWLCSNCRENIIFSMHESDRTEKQRYCCKCGARMDGETE